MREHGQDQRFFTPRFLDGLKAQDKPYKVTEYAPRGDGRLLVRVLPNGLKLASYRYRPNGKDTTLALGRYCPEGKNGLKLVQLRALYRDKVGLQRTTGDVKQHERAAKTATLQTLERGSLVQLLAAYVDHLERQGKPSAKAVKGIFRRNVEVPFPIIARKHAADVVPGDIALILSRMVKAGITRQVNVTRSYLGAAFAYGAKADNDPRRVSQDGSTFGLKVNPVKLVPSIREYEKTRERNLTDSELHAYWLELESLPIEIGATLRVNLALACQRAIQLIRADWPDFDFAERTLLLRDSKGKGGSRDHLLPLTSFALEQLKPLRERNVANCPPFSTDGVTRINDTTLSHAVADISLKLQARGIPAFQLRDLRRTAETMLQKLGVDKEVRAHLLSHGRTAGVQGRHYERYDYLPEKRAALASWTRHLERIITGKAARVTRLRAA